MEELERGGMDSIAKSGRGRRRTLDRVVGTLLIAAVAIAIGGVGLITVYLNRISEAVTSVERADALPSYLGRPSAVLVNGKSPINYLLLTTDADGGLDAAVIAHLSSGRSELTLVAVPASLVVDTDRTLEATFQDDPLQAAQAVEGITGARMDHQVQIDLEKFEGVVDALGGVTIDEDKFDGAGIVEHLSGSPNPRVRSVRIARMLKATLSRASVTAAITDPNQFDKLMSALEPCLTVDDGLTAVEIRETISELRVHPGSVAVWPLTGEPAGIGSVAADASALATLRASLRNDSFPTPVPTGPASSTPTVSPAASTSQPPSDPSASGSAGSPAPTSATSVR